MKAAKDEVNWPKGSPVKSWALEGSSYDIFSLHLSKHHPIFLYRFCIFITSIFVLPWPYLAERDELIPTWEESSGGGEA